MSDEKIEAPRPIDDEDMRDALDEAAWFAQPSEINDERHDLARAVVALKARLAIAETELDKLKALRIVAYQEGWSAGAEHALVNGKDY